MARSSLLPMVLLAAMLGLALRQVLPSQEAFATPRREAAAALAAAVTAGMVAPSPAVAEGAKFSFFGFGMKGSQSDAYSINDNPTNPYSQFSDGTDTVYQKNNAEEVARKKKQMDAAIVRLERVPELIRTKQAQQITSNLLEAGGTMKVAMQYLSGDRDSPAWNKAREFSQAISDLGVSGGRQKAWPQATEDYNLCVKTLGEWKRLVQY
eukprot:TRINITY_DN4011_c0_g1_i6.p1 TRINITY_DN4011_c0_g1~~TRINITY_DN4011_c0_g1_i6.p1  ORF type:complete len:209 (+),score=58.08 TRINITY_DN4011_c0_g1_i6:60-686(+)